MKTLAINCSLLILPMLLTWAWAGEAGKQVGDFSLVDQHGNVHQMSLYNNRRGIVLLTSSSDCSMSEEISSTFSRIQNNLVDLGFEFMLLNSSTAADSDRLRQEIRQLNLNLPVLIDENLLMSEFLGVRKTNEVIVYDPKSLSVIYRGSADRNLQLALFSILAGKQVMNSISNSSGCEIDYPGAAN